MSVHYKFKSALESDTVTFDGLHISLRDLKNAIMQQKRIGKNNDFDLQVTNAETKEVYDNEETLIPKNTALLIARIPSLQTKPKVWEGYGDSSSPISKIDDLGPIAKAMDLATLDASEEDKIKAMMSQSTQDYDPSNYMKIRGANQVGTVPSNYRCYKCHQGGHWIKDCTLNQGTTETLEIKKSTGIPRSFMIAVEGPQVQGAMITPNGSFAVPALDHQAYTEKSHPAQKPEELKPEIPEDLVCSICSDLLTDAVMIPCCGDSYCDECIRSCLLESEEHECPACHEKDISPGTLIPNRYLRNSVLNFKSTTGYIKRPIYRPLPTPVIPTPESNVTETEPVDKQTKEDTKSTEEVVVNTEPKESKASPVIAEESQSTSDSTVENVNDEKRPENEQQIQRLTESSKRRLSRDEQNVHNIVTNSGNYKRLFIKFNSNDRSPRRRYHKSSPTYQHRNDRGGTPTIDEPGMPPSTSLDPISVYQQQQPAPIYGNAAPPPAMGIIGMPPPPIQVPPGNFGPVSNYPPPNQGIMQPNFRMPPPGAPSYPPGGYPPRPMYDMGRVPSYPPPYQSTSRGSKSRDYHREYRRGRSPPNAIVDDPLEAFNRMLREKDERDRRAKQRKGRSFSRSSSRSVSPSPPPRKIRTSRSPRRRSRSRSFSVSRSRSRSFSPGPRVSPAARNFSPKRPYRKVHGRYPSPPRSPPRFRARDDDREHRQDREAFGYRDEREREYRDREARGRDFKYYDNFDRSRGKGRPQWNGPRNPPEQFYQAPNMAVQQPYIPPNRYPPPHEVYPPHHIQQQTHQPPSQVQLVPPPIHTYADDVVPPGTEQPPVPGLENAPSIEERYQYTGPIKEVEPIKQNEAVPNLDLQQNRDQHKHDVGGTPERKYYSPPPRKQERDHEYQTTPDKHHKRRKHDDATDRKRDPSDDERSSRKNKDRKRKKEKREKKEEERRKRRERREKREQEKQNKKAVEEKERLERKHKREVLKHDVETQASNDEDEENVEMESYDDRTNKYYTNDEVDEEQQELDDHHHYKQISQDINETVHAQINNEVLQEVEAIPHNHDESPKSEEPHSPEMQHIDLDLYEDALPEEIDTNIIENYVKKVDTLEKEISVERSPVHQVAPRIIEDDRDEGEITDDGESEKDVLELHTNEAELKIEAKSDVLAPLPEKSKWEVDEDLSINSSSSTGRGDMKFDRSDKLAKVTNEVLKRAENAIFAKAINAIRPIEIKKISMDRAKLYSSDRDKDKSGDELREEARNIQITITGGSNYDNNIVKVEPDKSPPKVRLSVKERLGCKVDDIDRIVKIDRPYDRNRSHSLSPLSRRSDLMSRNLGLGERRYDLDNRNRSNSRLNFRERNDRLFRNDNQRDRINRNRNDRKDRDRRRKDDRKSTLKSTTSTDKKLPSRRKSPSVDEKDKHKRRDKHEKERKKEKVKHHKKDAPETESTKQTVTKPSKNEDDKNTKQASSTDKRKPTLDEASFEPDYDLESESDKEDTVKKEKSDKTKHSDGKSVERAQSKKRIKPDNKKYSSSSGSSTSSDERRRQRHRKHRRRKDRRDSSSSSSSESDSGSTNDRDKRQRQHKKKSKKRKKSKHK